MAKAILSAIGLKFCVEAFGGFFCDGQGNARKAILYEDRSCFIRCQVLK